ncbi:MAG: ferrochelatase, partial [Pseudomonadota bacterium]
DATLKALPEQGIKSVQVICPGFASDCLETIEEIDEENRDYFLAAGGERFNYIPCLNADHRHIMALSTIIEQQLDGWGTPESQEPAATKARAIALGARA